IENGTSGAVAITVLVESRTWRRASRDRVALAVLKTWAETVTGSPGVTAWGVAVTSMTSAAAGRIETTVAATWLTTDSAGVTWGVKIVDDWMVWESATSTEVEAPGASVMVLWPS